MTKALTFENLALETAQGKMQAAQDKCSDLQQSLKTSRQCEKESMAIIDGMKENMETEQLRPVTNRLQI